MQCKWSINAQNLEKHHLQKGFKILVPHAMGTTEWQNLSALIRWGEGESERSAPSPMKKHNLVMEMQGLTPLVTALGGTYLQGDIFPVKRIFVSG